MGSAASAAPPPQAGERMSPPAPMGRPPSPEGPPAAGRPPTPPDQETPQVDVSSTLENHIVDIQPLRSEEEEEEEEEEARQVEERSEGEELSLDFESFLHNNGTLYSCFKHQGRRVYVDEAQNLQPFPSDWLDQGRFVTAEDSGHLLQTLTEDDRTGSIFIQGKGNLTTYMFEEKVNVCRFWDPHVGQWLLLPLQWEVCVASVQEKVRRVTASLPGLEDQKEIAAALRQCNYEADEVVSLFLAIFGDVLLQASPGGAPGLDPDPFRAAAERERVMEGLRQQVRAQERETEGLVQRSRRLEGEVRYLTDVVQHQNRRAAELEADRQEAREKIRALLSRRPPSVPPAGAAADPGRLRRLGLLTRELNVSAEQLRSAARLDLQDLQNLLRQLREPLLSLAAAERRRAEEAEELRRLYRKEAAERKSLHNELLDLRGNIRVFCRVRKSSSPDACLEVADDRELLLLQKGGAKKRFRFDKVFPPGGAQEDVFAEALPLITSCVDGYNVCILAYGQTGSGKTYTMTGGGGSPGVNIRSVRELLRICAEKTQVSFRLEISMLEIYNDALNDLLSKSPGAAPEIRVQGKSVSVPGLTRVRVQTEADILGVMETGEKNRKMAATKMNTQSSRSHLLVALDVQGSDLRSGLTSRGTLTLCDLAGSERISRTEAEGPRLVEAAAINKSLTALGQVFNALKCNALHVPFRNSKLTHLLQPCLSGDAKSCVLVHVSPEEKDATETLSTLQFATSVRQVAPGKAPPTRTNRKLDEKMTN